jgi:maltooligosyltrehalose trehalohydrolase
VKPEQLVVSAQNHDQVGNRALGERLSVLLNPIQLQAAAALTILSPFVPLLFQGEEWGASTPFLYFTDHQDHTLAEAVAEGRRKEFRRFDWADEVPNPQAPETFANSRLDWNEPAQNSHKQLLAWYRKVIALRASIAYPSVIPLAVSCDAEAGWLWFTRGDLCVAVNFTARQTQIDLPPGDWHLLLTSVPGGSGTSNWAAFETRVYARHL